MVYAEKYIGSSTAVWLTMKIPKNPSMRSTTLYSLTFTCNQNVPIFPSLLIITYFFTQVFTTHSTSLIIIYKVSENRSEITSEALNQWYIKKEIVKLKSSLINSSTALRIEACRQQNMLAVRSIELAHLPFVETHWDCMWPSRLATEAFWRSVPDVTTK